jgi:dihydropyrimidine dehydrogenase (NAD+) subunit PreA
MENYEKKLAEKFLINESSRCLLCHDAVCDTACKNGEISKFIKAVRFDVKNTAYKYIENCDKDELINAEKNCIHYDYPIRISEMSEVAKLIYEKTDKRADLSINFCGIKCENPFFLSSSVVASNYDMCAKALDMGWGGIVFKTIGLLKPKEVSPRFDITMKESTPFLGLRNLEQIAEHPLEENLQYLKQLKKDYPQKVIVASIMGQTEDEWTELAKMVTEIGCDIIECNFSCPHMSGNGLGSDIGQNPDLVKRYTHYTRMGTKLPILAKMTPNLGNMEIPAIAAIEGGANGIAAINTIKSISGIDLKNLSANPSIKNYSAVSGYSGKAVKPIALRFIHDIAKDKNLKGVPISGMGGIENWQDATEFIMLGCTNIQITTAVMQYGYQIIDYLIEGLSNYMINNGYKSIDEMVGLALSNIIPAESLDRDTLIFPKFVKEHCIGCGRCYISCLDAGHQAIEWKDRTPKLKANKCVGCHLCKLVCPVEAIEDSKRIKKPY